MDRMVVFNVAWMKKYEGVTPNDVPVHGGAYVNLNGYGSEVYNFLPHNGKMYGFVEAGWKPILCRINITKLGASKHAQSVSNITVVWVARHRIKPETLVVGWYKNATVFRERQKAPLNSNRKLPDGRDAIYFVEADKCDCARIPFTNRDILVPRGVEGGLGQKNIWYLDSRLGKTFKTNLFAYISKNHNTFSV
ncbi:hypothetical protein ACFLYB_00265 [Chloroflexota bacterium]